MLRVWLPTRGTTGNISSSCAPATIAASAVRDVGDGEVQQPSGFGQLGYGASGEGEPEDPCSHRLRTRLFLTITSFYRDPFQHLKGVGLPERKRHDHHSVEVAPCLDRLLVVERYLLTLARPRQPIRVSLESLEFPTPTPGADAQLGKEANLARIAGPHDARSESTAWRLERHRVLGVAQVHFGVADTRANLALGRARDPVSLADLLPSVDALTLIPDRDHQSRRVLACRSVTILARGTASRRQGLSTSVSRGVHVAYGWGAD